MSRLITGAGGGGGKGGGGGSSRVAVEARDSLRSKAYARVMDVVSEGEIEGLVDGLKSVYLDGTPIQNADLSMNFTGVEFSSRNGTQAQAYLEGFPLVESSTAVAVEVTTATSVTRQITNPSVDAMRVTIGVPQLTSQNTSNGDLNGTSVQYAIDLQSNGGGYSTVLTETITGKTTTRYQRSHRVELTGSPPWDIRVRRITADSVSAALQNKTWWDSYTEIIDAKLRYPNSALVGLKVDSSQFQSIPTRGYDMKLLRVKVPSNYNATTRAYTGSWDGNFVVAWTDNPAWCFYDLVTNDRYGLGGIVDDALVDKWALYTIGKYCDELVDDGFGGTEPRFTCNMYLQTRQEAYKVLRDFASIFRGMIYWSSGAITATQDAPSDPVALFANANVINGRFTYAGSSLKARHTVALVTWNDPDDVFTQKVEYVEDTEGVARYGVQQTEIVAVGCTSRGQANRAGRWLLYSERLETETVQFSIGLDGTMVRPGHIIKVADAARASARLGGRVSTATASTITVDRAPTLSITGWTLYCTLTDGTVASSTVASLVGSVITVSPALPGAPAAQSIWVLSGPSVEAQTFRVISVAEDAESGHFAVGALAHDPLKFDAIENGLVLQPRDITLLNNVPAAPTGLALSESLYTYQSEVRAKINIGWIGVEGAYKYVVEWRKDSGNWTRDETQTAEYEILDITPGVFEVKVYARNAAGLTSGTALTGSLTALGKTAPPSTVAAGQATPQNFQLLLDWDSVEDLDVVAYEVRTADSGFGTAGYVFRGLSTSCLVAPAAAGVARTWYVRALDSSKRYSTASLAIAYTAAALPDVGTITETFADTSLTNATITLDWPDVSPVFGLAGYRVTYGAVLKTVKASTITLPADWLGSRTFTVQVVDNFGNVSTGTSKSITKLGPNQVTGLRAQVIDNNVLLYWNLPAKTTLPVQDVIVRKGATWGTAENIGTKAGGFTSLSELASGVYTYWVAVRDTDNNQSTPVSVTAAVSEPPNFVFHGSFTSTYSGAKSSAVIDPAGGLVLPVNTAETWATHFSLRGWATPAAQVAAGYPIFIQPANGSGYYQETFDFGSILSSSQITVSLGGVAISGSPVVTTVINTSDDNVIWSADIPGTQAFGTAFRYVRVKVAATEATGTGLYKITSLVVRLDAKQKDDSGTVSAVSTDASGTIVNFSKPFIDVTSISVSPAGTTAVTAVYNFQDANISGTYSVTSNVATINATAHDLVVGQKFRLMPSTGTAPLGVYTVASVVNANQFTASITTANTSGNSSVYPQGFRVYLFNSAGTRVNGSVSWLARGY